MTADILRGQLCDAARRMERMGLTAGTSGNISVRVPGTDRVLITPSGLPYEEYAPERMCLVDLEGRLLEGELQPSSETPMHTMLYRSLDRAGAIVHTHSVYALTFAALGMSIPVLGLEGIGFGAVRIPCTERFATPGSPELGASVLAALEKYPGANGVLLRNHGAIAMGNALGQALELARSVELTARVYYQALSIGRQPQALTGGQITDQLRFYAQMKERFQRDNPGKKGTPYGDMM